MTVRLEALVSGRVQGVGFREWARRRAGGLQLGGSATNLVDGRVEVIVEGSREACEALLDHLRGDRTPGYVDDVAVTWTDPTGAITGFVTR